MMMTPSIELLVPETSVADVLSPEPAGVPVRSSAPALDESARPAVDSFQAALVRPIEENAILQQALEEVVRQVARSPLATRRDAVSPAMVPSVSVPPAIVPSEEYVASNCIAIAEAGNPSGTQPVRNEVLRATRQDVVSPAGTPSVSIPPEVEAAERPLAAPSVQNEIPKGRLFVPVAASERGGVPVTVIPASDSVPVPAVPAPASVPVPVVPQPASVPAPAVPASDSVPVPVVPQPASVPAPAVPVSDSVPVPVVPQPASVPAPASVPLPAVSPVDVTSVHVASVEAGDPLVVPRGGRPVRAVADETELADAVVAAGGRIADSVVLAAVPQVVEAAVPVTAVDAVTAAFAPAAIPAEETFLAAANAVADVLLVSPGLLRGEGEIRVQLRPDVLEGAEVRISVAGRQLDVAFVPRTPDVAALIEQNRPQLEQHLAARFLTFRLSVGVLRRTADDAKGRSA